MFTKPKLDSRSPRPLFFFFCAVPAVAALTSPTIHHPPRLAHAHAHAHVYATPLPPLSSPCPVYSGSRFNSLKKERETRESCEDASDNCPEKSGHPVLSGNGRA